MVDAYLSLVNGIPLYGLLSGTPFCLLALICYHYLRGDEAVGYAIVKCLKKHPASSACSISGQSETGSCVLCKESMDSA